MLKLADLKIKTKKQITSKNNKLSYLAIITLEQKKTNCNKPQKCINKIRRVNRQVGRYDVY